MNYITPADRSQLTMMGCLDDLVPPNHPVRLIDLVVDRIVEDNPAHFGTEPPGETGRPPYAPATMLKLYVYGYINHVHSSRRLEVETERNIELIWLLGKLSPDHWTIAHYRKTHREDIALVHRKFQEFLHDTGYIKGDRVGIDGSKVKANAKRDMLTLEKIERRLEQADEKLQEYFNALAENDARDDLDDELEQHHDATEQEQQLKDKIAALQAQVEQLQHQKALLENTQRRALSLTDPDASLMKTRDGKMPAYNVQFVVDDVHKLIAASNVLTDQDDHAALPQALTELKEQLNIEPQEVLADKGYYTPDIIEQIERDTCSICYIPVPKKEPSADTITFTYDAITDCYTCSEGKPLPLFTKNKHKRNSIADVYRGSECGTCRVRAQCTQSSHGRMVHRYHNQTWRDTYKERMMTSAVRAIVALRKTLVEHPFGTIKCWAGKLPLLLRGLVNVTTEIKLYVTAYNFKRLLNIEPIDRLVALAQGYRWILALPENEVLALHCSFLYQLPGTFSHKL